MTTIDFNNFPKVKRDLTNSLQNAKVLELAQQIYKNTPHLLQLEDQLFRNSEFVQSTSPVLLEAIKCATSKKLLSLCNQKVHLSVVFAMYNETPRLSTKEENVHGEDCLREKVRQLEWLTSEFEDMVTWELIAVDDGCPLLPSSAQKARDILDLEKYKNVEVLELKDALSSYAISPGFTDLVETKDSRKGGAIAYGIWKAKTNLIAQDREHIIIYTDADLSSNLGQTGSFVHPILNEGKHACIAQRYGVQKSVLVKENETTTEPESTRLQPGKLIILLRHFARVSMLPLLEHVSDTQAGFKAFRAKELGQVLLFMEFMNETFDVELLLRFISNYGKKSIVGIPVIFTEDLAMSNFPANSVNSNHLDMFKQIVYIYDKIGYRQHAINNKTLRFWRRLNYSQLQNLISHFAKNPPEDLDELLFNFRWSLDDLRQLASA